LPDVAGQVDGAYFRLEYPPNLNLAARLYKFSIIKNKWVYVETDRRSKNNSHTPSQREIFGGTFVSPTTKKL
jgi:predicted dinucleotide-utilizing enzyme